jgi:hypothetical protein
MSEGDFAHSMSPRDRAKSIGVDDLHLGFNSYYKVKRGTPRYVVTYVNGQGGFLFTGKNDLTSKDWFSFVLTPDAFVALRDYMNSIEVKEELVLSSPDTEARI